MKNKDNKKTIVVPLIIIGLLLIILSIVLSNISEADKDILFTLKYGQNFDLSPFEFYDKYDNLEDETYVEQISNTKKEITFKKPITAFINNMSLNKVLYFDDKMQITYEDVYISNINDFMKDYYNNNKKNSKVTIKTANYKNINAVLIDTLTNNMLLEELYLFIKDKNKDEYLDIHYILTNHQYEQELLEELIKNVKINEYTKNICDATNSYTIDLNKFNIQEDTQITFNINEKYDCQERLYYNNFSKKYSYSKGEEELNEIEFTFLYNENGFSNIDFISSRNITPIKYNTYDVYVIDNPNNDGTYYSQYYVKMNDKYGYLLAITGKDKSDVEKIFNNFLEIEISNLELNYS